MAAPTSQPNSREQSHPEPVEPASQSNEPKSEEELKKEAEQRFQHVNFPERQVQIEEWRKEAQQFETDFSDMELKIHRFPAYLQGLDRRYIFPTAVSIGLYHRNSSNLQEMEKVKRVAAHHFISESGHTFDEMYAAVLSVVGTARRLYDAEFADLMFIDGCFLLQFMSVYTSRHKLPRSLLSCFKSNHGCILNDIMLLANQLPWLVVHTLRRFSSVPVGETWIWSQPVLDGSYTPPHLLGILWFYKIGGTDSTMPLFNPAGRFGSMSKSISAVELGEIGIKLTASKTTKFTDMGFKRGFLSSEIFLPPLFLDERRSCWLVNMAAFEVSVGTYIGILAILMDREEDVHKLRSKRLVQSELTNKETLHFFKMIANRITDGPLYFHILKEVEAYKVNRWMWIKVHQFVYENFKAIVTLFSIAGVLVGIFKTLLSLKIQ